MPGIDPEEQQGWLCSVLDLLPSPAQLIEPETGRVLFVNGSARLLPFFAPPDDDGYQEQAREAKVPLVGEASGPTILIGERTHSRLQ
jgi:hypothetical protein